MTKYDINKVAKQRHFINIALLHRCSPVNLLHTFRTPFLKNNSGWLLLKSKFEILKYQSTEIWTFFILKIKPRRFNSFSLLHFKGVLYSILASHPAGIYLFKVNNRNTRTKMWNVFKVNYLATINHTIFETSSSFHVEWRKCGKSFIRESFNSYFSADFC